MAHTALGQWQTVAAVCAGLHLRANAPQAWGLVDGSTQPVQTNPLPAFLPQIASSSSQKISQLLRQKHNKASPLLPPVQLLVCCVVHILYSTPSIWSCLPQPSSHCVLSHRIQKPPTAPPAAPAPVCPHQPGDKSIPPPTSLCAPPEASLHLAPSFPTSSHSLFRAPGKAPQVHLSETLALPLLPAWTAKPHFPPA